MPHVTMLVSNRAGATYIQKSTICRNCGKRCGRGMRQHSKTLLIRPLAAFSVCSASGTPKCICRGLSASKPISKPGIQSHWSGGTPPGPPLTIQRRIDIAVQCRSCVRYKQIILKRHVPCEGSLSRFRLFTGILSKYQVKGASVTS